jgi:hypothetical protein
MSDNYIVVSGMLFGLIAVGQAVRALNQWPLIVAGVDVPVWMSWAAAAVMGSMCVWAFRSGRK